MLSTTMISFVLSQFLGLYLCIVAAIMFRRVNDYRKMISSMDPHSGTLVLGGLIGLLLGMFFVGIHNVWVLHPIVFVTIFCWLFLVLSVMYLSFPVRMVLMTRKLFLGSGYYVLISVMIIFGLLFLSRGVYLYVTNNHSFLFT